MSEAITLASVFHTWEERATAWMAFNLSDGSTDHVLYPSKTAAVQHQPNEYRCCYIALRGCVAGMPVKDAQIMLDYHRFLYDNGFPLVDPSSGPILPLAKGTGFGTL